MRNSIVIAIIAGVAITTIAGLTYLATTFEDNPFEMQSTEWEGIHTLSDDADEWDIKFHKEWCVSNNGVWFEPNECRWDDEQERRVALGNLKFQEIVEISGRFANQICDTMDIPCPENVTFEGVQDIKTGDIRYEGHNLGNIYRFKIADDQLYYIQESIDDKKWPSDEGWILVKET